MELVKLEQVAIAVLTAAYGRKVSAERSEQTMTMPMHMAAES